VAKKARDKGKR